MKENSYPLVCWPAPLFSGTWRKDLALSDHTLKIPAKTVYQYETKGNLTKKVPSTDGSYRLDAPDLINNIFNQTTVPSAEISLGNGEETIRISEVGGAEVGSRLTFVTWTKPESPYYCLEPWMSPPNSPANETTRLVAPSARDEFTIEIELA